VAYALDGFAFSAEALVGNAMGARARATLRRAAILSSFWGLILCALLSALFWGAGGAIIDLMTTAPEVREAARAYLPWIVLAPVLGLWCFMLDGIFIGATRTADMRNMMLLSAVIYFAAALALMPALGNHGLWAALMISYVARAATLGARYPALERAVDG
jgi:MATE family multidrug resistance protein